MEKEERVNLNDNYIHVEINATYCEYQKYLEDNPDAKKSKKIRIFIKDG